MRFVPEDKICQQCGKTFRVTRRINATRKYCSGECYHAYEAEHGGHSKYGPTDRVHFNCARCGKPFEFQPGQLRAYRKAHGKDPLYCSRACGWVGKRKTEGKSCIVCGKPVPVRWDVNRNDGTPRTVGLRNTICSSECRSALKRAEHERLRPLETREITRSPAPRGYVWIRVPRTETEPAYQLLEHRYVMQQQIGRKLRPEETVHHRNAVRDDNRPENLELFTSRHGPGARVVDQVDWAIDLLTDYADFAERKGFKLVKI